MTITSGGTAYQAIPVYVSAGQVGAVMPSAVPSGAATVTVTSNGQTSAAFNITVVDTAFGVFAVNQAGSGPGVVTDATTFAPTGLLTSAKPGQYMTIWGTGLGPITTDETQPPPQTDMTNVPVKVWVGGQEAQVTYRGRASCCAGLDQIVFIVPPQVVNDCYVPVLVQAGNTVSNSTTIPVAANGGACDPALSAILAKPSFRLGTIYLSRFQPGVTIFPGLPAIPIALDGGLAQFATYTPALANSVSSPNKLPARGTCIVNTFKGDATNAIPMDPVVAPGLDAGIAIAVTGPKGTKPLKQVTKGYYSASLSENSGTNPTGTPFLERGTYTVTNGDGGADVKPFSLTLTLPDPDPITWTNKADLANATRGQNLTLKWTTTDPQAVVIISGTSTAPVGSRYHRRRVFLRRARQRGNVYRAGRYSERAPCKYGDTWIDRSAGAVVPGLRCGKGFQHAGPGPGAVRDPQPDGDRDYVQVAGPLPRFNLN